MHHDIKPERQRAVNGGRGERIIRDAYQPAPARQPGNRFEIRQFQQRIGRRLDPDHPGFRADRRLQRREIVRLHPGNGQPGGALTHIFQQPVRTAVHIIHRHDMALFVEQLQHRGNRRQPGSEREPLTARFKLRDGALERVARRVAAARIFITGMLAGRGLRVGGSGVNRRHHRAMLIVMRAAVHAERCEFIHDKTP